MAEEKKGPNWKLEDDYERVTVTFPTEPPVALELRVAEIEEILKNLGEFRAHMKPEIQAAYQMGQRVMVLPDPKWATEPDLMIGNSLLHIRDPRFGWLHYMIPKEEARKLAQLLQAQVDAQPPDLNQVSQVS